MFSSDDAKNRGLKTFLVEPSSSNRRRTGFSQSSPSLAQRSLGFPRRDVGGQAGKGLLAKAAQPQEILPWANRDATAPQIQTCQYLNRLKALVSPAARLRSPERERITGRHPRGET